MGKKIYISICSMLLICGLLFGSSQDTHAEEKKGTSEIAQTGYRQSKEIEVEDKSDIHVFKERYKSSGASEWDIYGTDYYYKQMNSNEKALYDKLYKVALDLLTNQTDASEFSYKDATSGENITLGVAQYVEYSGITLSEAKTVVSIFQLSNPQFYFLNEYIFNIQDSPYVTFGVYNEFVNGKERALYTSQFKSTIESWVDQITEQSSVLEIEKKAHDLICSNTVYGESTFDQSCYSVFLEGTSVCAGYAEAFELLCNAVGIDTLCITSNTHEWNKVYLYDKWYVVDCTWDDQDTTYYNYFNTSDKVAEASSHDHDKENFWSNYNVPVCSYDTVKKATSYPYNGMDYALVFDPDYYMAQNSDIRKTYKADINMMLKHFVDYGMNEGRKGNKTFNVYSYANNYEDLRKVYGNDLKAYYLHYINYGKSEGRKCTGNDTSLKALPKTTVYNGVDYSAVYDYDYYVKNNPDVFQAYGEDENAILGHFVNYGMQEGRQAIETFNVISYCYQYVDLRQAYGTDLKSYYMHYVQYGKKEGRAGVGCTCMQDAITVYNGVDYSAVYNFKYYTEKYEDIKKAYPYNDIAVLEHFIMYGMDEGRQASSTFNVESYCNQYVDLRRAYGTNLKSYYMHYVQYGEKEGRVGVGCTCMQDAVTIYNGVDYSAVYDYNYYIKKYTDIESAFRYDDQAALEHFVTYGMNELRQASELFNVYVYVNNYEDLRRVYNNDWKSYYIHYIQYGKVEGRKAI